MSNDDFDSDQPQEIEVEAEEVLVSSQPIELYKVLKLANLVEGGGQAKHLIAEGYVAVNGEVEFRKRCKTYDGDVVQVGEHFFVVVFDENAEQYEAFEPVEEPQEEPEQWAESEVEQVAEVEPEPEPLISREKAGAKKSKKGQQGRKSIDFF